jgi:hypothetical protein
MSAFLRSSRLPLTRAPSQVRPLCDVGLPTSKESLKNRLLDFGGSFPITNAHGFFEVFQQVVGRSS